ncbi:hypothetical protein [Streptomyces sp. Da 82-17]|uniref:hypothetical protein n=1 Tax=Streptomyces sp. Da 82-17 TaxID=3377116 RepID=UPI0038D4780C
MKRRTTLFAAAVLGACSLTAHAQAADEGAALVRVGDIDLLEDVYEHVSIPDGPGSRTVHQMYDSSAAAAD